ncbi:MAG TPA: hypothetical protein VL084_08985 [Thermoanaerobaculia bacterium]|nr:hypothetical protein [Thermoanaerobaculia bacterium]
MLATLTAAIVAISLLAAVLIGRRLRRLLPEGHRSAETRDTVKLSLGLVATMTALLLGLLVSSAKSSYDATRGQVIQMAARVAYLDRVLLEYGPEAADARFRLRAMVEGAVRRIWPAEKGTPSQLTLERHAGDEFLTAMMNLSPQDDRQRALKAQATTVAFDLGQSREQLMAQSVPSISTPLLIVVVTWLMLIFLGFSLIAPTNATATLSLMVSALSVSGAIFLILELDQPFAGLMRISSEPMLRALSQLANQSP